tara:strand:- start:29 stop:871 length:843 start_codon:yes stop_codon:yes gene_type:complete
MKLLELFSGTHSIGVVAKEMDLDVVSLDRDLESKSKLFDYTSECHIQSDIMTWDYKSEFNEGDFYIITASPVCLFWSVLRNTWIGRESKTIKPQGGIVTMDDINADIEKYGKPMVDKVIEIIEYFKPSFYWIENPQTGTMKHYIAEKYPEYNTFYDVDYCKYSDWGYQKKTRFWTNIQDFKPKLCKKDCENIIVIEKQKLHKNNLGSNNKINIDGKIINCNTKALRIKYRKELNNISKIHKNSLGGSKNKNQKCIGGGSNRLERYRVPFPLIRELLECCL